MPKPVMATQMGRRVKRKRCFVKSEAKAMIIAKAKAAAHGGTEWTMLGLVTSRGGR